MSQPPGPPDPDPARNPWATPSGEPVPAAPRADPPPYPPPLGQPYAVPPTNGKAQAAMWLGIGLLLTSLCGVGILGPLPVVLGVLARREIAGSGGRQRGDGMALAGIVTGALALVISLLVVVAVVVAVVVLDSGGGGYGDTGV